MPGTADLAKQLFADQFEPHGLGYLYRKHQRAAPIRITADERDRYVRTYNRWMTRSMIGLAVLTAVVLMGLALFLMSHDIEVLLPLIMAPIAVVLAIFVFVNHWIFTLPARELAGRLPSGPERSRDEVAKRAFQKLTYGQIAIAAGIFVFALWRFTHFQHLFEGWNRLWLGLCIAAIAFGAFQAFRKWRFDKSGRV